VNGLELARRIDEACLNAWLALRQVSSDGLVLPFSNRLKVPRESGVGSSTRRQP
jgi:hypothetical protein